MVLISALWFIGTDDSAARTPRTSALLGCRHHAEALQSRTPEASVSEELLELVPERSTSGIVFPRTTKTEVNWMEDAV